MSASNFRPVEFPVEDGVEIRTMGQNLRPVRIYFESKADSVEHPPGSTSWTHPTISGRMFLVDLEERFQLIPGVEKFTFDKAAVRGMIGGRLVRRTQDHIETADGKDFSHGYLRSFKSGSPSRLVSEPFMVFGVVTLGTAEFDKQHDLARANYERENPALMGGWE
jgi:hypothetical protein